ncbi:interactor of HORMAD1 protein 1 isoform X1 [Carcharodon carcharias]|uniref:interactor of HORMAD1 protein 1 isoform X1 n=1 Tax=Carcharodon carcharias TaxID=13397 RepID=UPI001B7E70FC|nr:interactor of HORMAD1 protein 1 isoform X1 [Carcharodon carcharias]
MNSNLWNIREMLSIPTGPGITKTSTRNSAPSDYSSLTDSQFLFGSQFCPENSETQDFNLPSRTQKNSQQNSQQIESESKFYEKYQAKPYLFATDGKETRSLTQFCAGKPKGFLEQFEIRRRKAKDKEESELFNSWISKLQDSVEGIIICFNNLEKKAELHNRSVLEGLENMSKTMQENITKHYESIVSALEAKNSTEQILEMDKRLVAKEMEVSNLRTQLQLMQECLDGIQHSQCQQHQKMYEQLSWFKDHFQVKEILSELHKLTSKTSPIIQVQNNMTQTTPCSNVIVSRKKAYYESTRVCRTSFQPQPVLMDNYQLPDTKAVCAESSSNHLNVHQKTLPEAARMGQCTFVHELNAMSSCRGKAEVTSPCSTATNSNHIISACPINQVAQREVLPSKTLSHADVKLAEYQNGSRSKSPCTSNAPEQHSIQKIHHNDKENKWGPITFNPSVKYKFDQNMWQDINKKSNNTRRDYSAVAGRKMATGRCCTKRRTTYVTHSKKKENIIKAPDKSKTKDIIMKQTALDKPKIKAVTQRQIKMSEKKAFGNASCEKRRHPLEGLSVRDGSWQGHVKKGNYPQQQNVRKEIPKGANRNLSQHPPNSLQENCLQNGMESEHKFQSWFSPLSLTQESSYDNLPNPLFGKEAQNKTQLNLFDSSDDSD